MPGNTVQCHQCGGTFSRSITLEAADGHRYCPAHITPCVNCGILVSTNQAHLSPNGKPYCDNCVRHCDDCNDTLDQDRMYTTWTGNNICENCYGDHYLTCDWCEAVIPDDDTYEVVIRDSDWDRIGDRIACRECVENRGNIDWDDEAEEYYITEENFNMPNRNITWPTGDQHDPNRILQESPFPMNRLRCPECDRENDMCADCQMKLAQNKKKELTTLWVYDTQLCCYHDAIHNKFKSTKYKTPHEKPYLYYGVELEVVFADNANKVKTVHDFIEATGGLFVAEYDSSVDSIGNGAEFISRPLSYKAWTSKEIKDKLEKGFKVLKDNGAQTIQPDGCGMHVHLSRVFFEHNTKKKVDNIKEDIDWIFQVFQPEIEKISRRAYSNYCSSKKETVKQLIPSLMRNTGINIKYNIEKGHLPSTEMDRANHHACIVETRKTIEMRTFKSTIRLDEFLATIQFCRAVAHAARNMKLDTSTTFHDIISCKDGEELSTLINNIKLNTDKKLAKSIEVK